MTFKLIKEYAKIKLTQRLNRTASRPNDLIVDENPNTNSATHSDDEDNNETVEKQTFFGTDVSVEWLLKCLCERFKSPTMQTPQWILERLNKYTEKGFNNLFEYIKTLNQCFYRLGSHSCS